MESSEGCSGHRMHVRASWARDWACTGVRRAPGHAGGRQACGRLVHGRRTGAQLCGTGARACGWVTVTVHPRAQDELQSLKYT
ncbi:hypothetical protein CRG98_029415 [Punica granatum]|uniref:Uncharacterized protein n=1 Tax=Punica granatum TaxID=22663 RepID=A0A2I0J1S3_PUNGR|nr:hypothetical protein CRG98_029415 [Punica granatum]